jgi:hypothetical protein
MTTNDYHFMTHWRVKGSKQEVCDILDDAEALAVWWPSVYLDVKVREQGNDKGVGKVVELFTKGWLPYTLQWKFRVTQSNAPDGYTIEALGDFAGTGIWTFEQDGDHVNIRYDWRIKAEKGLLKNFSFIMKPVFSWNHLWAMKKGEESLKLELLRRREDLATAKEAVGKPPRPTFPHNFTHNRILR